MKLIKMINIPIIVKYIREYNSSHHDWISLKETGIAKIFQNYLSPFPITATFRLHPLKRIACFGG
jgi:hypothetical protein